jgi:hypothetical protein
MPDNGTELIPQLPPVDPPPLLPAPKRAVPVAAILLIAVALLGLAAVGYIAWQRGLLDSLVAPRTQPSPVKVSVVEDKSAVAGDSGKDPLDRLNDEVGGIKPYRQFAEVIRAMDAELEATKIESQAPGVLAEATKQRLYELQKLGTQFSTDYEDFETRAARDTQPKLQPYQDIVRKAFLERMRSIVNKAGQAYVVQKDANHPVFTIGDTFIAAVQRFGKADATPLRDEWLAAVHTEEQSELTVQYQPQIKEIQARIEKLKKTHREVDELLKAAPEYRIRGGVLGNTARSLLEIYDSLASRVEGDVVDFEQYVAKLPEENGGSDELKAKVDEFTQLAQQDHFYAFRETYKIYEQDRDLEHPAYARLKEHYKFVEEHWPTLKMQYQAQYSESETRWAKTFGGQD